MSGASIPLGGEQDKISLEVEVVQRDSSNLARQRVEKEVDQFLRAREYISSHSKISQFGAEYSLLCQHVESLVFCQEEEVREKGVTMIHLPSAKLTYQVYKLNRLVTK